MPTQKAVHGITVAHFLETHRDKLRMDLVVGEAGLGRLIQEGTINRPALALTGFFKYFANKRIQVIGAAEMTYLKTLETRRQKAILQRMTQRNIPCLVLTRNYQPTPPMLEVAGEMIFPRQDVGHLDVVRLAVDTGRRFNEEPLGASWAETLAHPENSYRHQGEASLGPE